MKKVLPALLLLISSAHRLHAQTPNHNIYHYSTENGLPTNDYRYVYQDSYGFLWLASYDGLFRWDGYSCKKYSHDEKDPASLDNDIVYAVFEDSHRRLWVGTIEGLNQYDRASDGFTKIELRRNSGKNPVNAISEDAHHRLWLGTSNGLCEYDPEKKACLTCYVNSYRIGFVSIRKPGESWDELQARVDDLRRSSFPPSSLVTSSSVSAMDPDVRDEVRQMLDAARGAGFRLRVVSTYRSPEQEALVMANGRGRTHTLTSLHSYGRAIDVSVGDGNLNNPSTRRSWIAFRRWVTGFRGNDFRVLGTPDRSWDWAHVEMPNARIGFRSVEDAIDAGRVCLARSSASACEFLPHLPQPN